MFLKSLVAVFLFFTVVKSEVPNFINVCNRNDINISACIINSIEALREKLMEGIPELDVPSIEPLAVDDMKSKELNLTVFAIKSSGIGKFEIKDLRADINKNRFAILINIPEINLKGQQEMELMLGSLKIKGRGPFTARFTNFIVAGKLKGRIIDYNNKQHLKFDPFEIQIQFAGEKQLVIEGLFKENAALEAASKDLIKENIDLILEQLKPEIELSLSNTLTRVANSITTYFTYDELFPK